MSVEADVLIVGAGPAGMEAAVEARRSGASVIVLDENGAAGGQIWRGATASGTAEVEPASRQASRTIRRFEQAGIQLLPSTRVVDVPEAAGGLLLALRELPGEPPEPVRIRYRSLVIATGARERFLPFPGWTLQGVYGAGGLQALAKSGFDVRGQRIVVAGSGPLLLAVAAHLRKQGAILAGVYEQASARQLLLFARTLVRDTGKLLQAAGYAFHTRSSPLRVGCWPVEAHGTDRLTAVSVTDGRKCWTIPCDALACGFHLVPNTELARLLGCELAPSGGVATNVGGQTSMPNIFAAGEVTGIGGVEAALLDGRLAGASAAASALERGLGGRRLSLLRARAEHLRRFEAALAQAFALRPELAQLARPETIVCRCEDVRFGALHTQRSFREAKLHTRCGMGPCQGRLCGAATQTLFGWEAPGIRPPLAPVPLRVLMQRTEQEPS